MTLKEFSVAVILFLGLACATANAKPLELPAIQVVDIEDSSTGREYELYIKLPEDYDPKGEKIHPVIYIADALWHIEIISGSIEYLVKDAILVGVSWEKGIPIQQSRMRDYTPNKYTGKNYQHPTGQAQVHLGFLKRDVFKYVESEFKADPAQRSYFGYSVSGTFGAYILLTQPDTFKNYMLGSPATLFGKQFAHEYPPIAEATPDSIDANVFVSVGSDEKPQYIEHAISLASFLKTNKADEAEVELTVIESADHGSAFPISALQALYWLADIYD